MRCEKNCLPLLLTALTLAMRQAAPARAQTRYAVQPLNFGAPTSLKPYINNAGLVIATGSSVYLYDLFGQTTTDLGALLYVVGFNDSGQIITNDYMPVLEPENTHLGQPDPSSGEVYQYAAGSVTQLARLSIYPTGINARGQVSGDISQYTSGIPTGGPNSYGAAIYDPATGLTTALDQSESVPDGGIFYYSAGINNAGAVAGISVSYFVLSGDMSVISMTSGPSNQNIFWDYQGYSPVFSEVMASVTPEAINNNGDVAGYWFNAADSLSTPTRAYLSGNHDLGTLGGVNSYGYALNDSGAVVGSSDVDANSPPTEHAFLYKNGAMTDLNALLVNGSGWTITSALGINNGGYIVGIGAYNGVSTYFLLSPQPTSPVAIHHAPQTASPAPRRPTH